MKIFILLLIFFGMNISANAGFNGLTAHSRANCVNNESISWDWKSYHLLGTVTQHYRYGQWIHGISTGWQNTWRSAGVHWGEAPQGSGWRVVGYHWIIINNKQVMFDQTDVDDCSIYDGWWDKNK